MALYRQRPALAGTSCSDCLTFQRFSDKQGHGAHRDAEGRQLPGRAVVGGFVTERGGRWSPGCGQARLRYPEPAERGEDWCVKRWQCPKRTPDGDYLELTGEEWETVTIALCAWRIGVPPSALMDEPIDQMGPVMALWEEPEVRRLARG